MIKLQKEEIIVLLGGQNDKEARLCKIRHVCSLCKKKRYTRYLRFAECRKCLVCLNKKHCKPPYFDSYLRNLRSKSML